MLKIIKNNKIIRVVYEWSSVDKLFCPNTEAVEDNEHTPEDYTNIEGEFVLNDDIRAIEYRQNKVRGVRNSYLEQFVDPICSNALRWADMSEEEKQVYIDYRRYLLDYTEQEDWYKTNPKTLEEWSN